ncbi:transposase [Streptomyces olivochromogenes]|uniref:Transposase n=1 Tax=Streptomyces olivochromogenes TaxID=1963 RepID=A0A250VSP8_STROL|nr:transposase [Streptomyces olivochromogenes]
MPDGLAGESGSHWVVERSPAWIMHARRHARDCEWLIQPAESLVTWAAITRTRRLTAFPRKRSGRATPTAEPIAPAWSGNGRERQPRYRHKPISLSALAMSHGRRAFTEVTWREGSRGPMWHCECGRPGSGPAV